MAATLIFTDKTSGGRSPIVNLDNVLQVSKTGSAFVGSDGNPSASQSRYGILFTFTGQGQNPQSLEWKYDNSEDRDYDMTWILNENAKQVGYSD